MWTGDGRDGRPVEYIGGALWESSVIPFLVPRHKVWLRPAAGVPCSNAANIKLGPKNVYTPCIKKLPTFGLL